MNREHFQKIGNVPVHKKESKNLIKNYRPISLLPIFSKIFERQNKLFTECQSSFIPGNSCVAQVLSITHEIYTGFDCSPTADVRGVFFDISKTFDQVWHESLLFKLQSYGIEVILLRLLKNYLSARQQRVFLHGQTSSWQNVSAGVPQGSVLGPLLFLIYINDLLDGITSSCKIFADSTSLFSKIERKSCSNFKLDKGLKTISKWAFRWKMLFNRDPRKQHVEAGFSHKNATTGILITKITNQQIA